MKRAILIILLFLPGVMHVHAQSSAPNILNATGGSAIVSGDAFDYSIGEMVAVSTYSGPGIVVTQGLLQPVVENHDGVVTIPLSSQLQVFPNPATSIVYVQYLSLSAGEITCRLMDMTGKIISKQTLKAMIGKNTAEVDITTLPCASYMLDVAVNGSTTGGKASYKIQKLK